MNTNSDYSPFSSIAQKDVARIVFNAAVCTSFWFGAKAASVEMFGARWNGIDFCFRIPFYWCALNVTSAAYWLDVHLMSNRKPDHTFFQCIIRVAFYHVGGLVAGIVITLRQRGLIDVSILQATLITLGSIAIVVAYSGLGLFIAKLRQRDDSIGQGRVALDEPL